MEILLILLISLVLAVWRLWLGGVPKTTVFGKRPDWLQYLVGGGIVSATVFFFTQSPFALLVGVLWLLYWRIYGHGFILDLSRDPHWFRKGCIRYVALGFAIAAVLEYVFISYTAWPLALLSVFVLGAYVSTYDNRDNLNYSWIPKVGGIASTDLEGIKRWGDHDQYHKAYAELISGFVFAFGLLIGFVI